MLKTGIAASSENNDHDNSVMFGSNHPPFQQKTSTTLQASADSSGGLLADSEDMFTVSVHQVQPPHSQHSLSTSTLLNISALVLFNQVNSPELTVT